jgi:hypothetical protein
LTRTARRDRATALEAVNVEELGRRVDHWVEAGVISREQGDAILALEGAHHEPAGGRRAVAVEVLGYLGGGLALVAGFVLGAESWTQLGHWGRVAVLALVTTVLLAAGWRLREDRGRVLPRLASVLWLAAVAAFAGLLAVLLGGRSDDALDDPSLWVAGGALVLAGGLYLLERRVLQQVALFAAVVATMVAAGDEFGWPWERVEGYGFLVLGLAWLELGRRGLVGPRRTSEALGSLVLGAGGPGRRGGRAGGLGAVARAGPGRRADRGRERAAPERAARDRGRGHGGVPGPDRRPALARPRRPPGHPAGRAGPGRGGGGPGPAAARRGRRAAAPPRQSRTAVRALTIPRP